MKGGRFITHMKKLNEPEVGLANFFASGPLALGGKLGPSCGSCPRSRISTPLASGHSSSCCRVPLRLCPSLHNDATATSSRNPSPRVRRCGCATRSRCGNESYHDSEFAHMLREHGVALVLADTAGRFPGSMT